MQGDPSVPHWTLLHREPVHTGWIRVRRDRYVLPTGQEHDWEVLEQSDAVAVLAFTDADTAVLFDQFRVGPATVVAETPGGLVDPGEDPIAAGLRELLEETGYRPRAVFPVVGELVAASSPRHKHVLVAAGCTRDQDPMWESTETGLVHEVPIPDLVEHVLSGEHTDAGLAARGLLVFARATSVPDGMEPLQRRIRDLLLPERLAGEGRGRAR